MKTQGLTIKYPEDQLKETKEKLKDTRTILDAYTKKMDDLPADTGSGGSRAHVPKILDPPKFKGSSQRADLDRWLDKVALYCAHYSIVTDKQKIVMALSCLESNAQGYMKDYYTKLRLEEPLGLWNDFVAELYGIYGTKDEKEVAKKEIEALWKNRDLASKDLLKYSEQYRTLARIIDYGGVYIHQT